MSMRINPLADGFAAEVTGYDLRTMDDRGDIDRVISLLDEHQVLVFRDQHLQPDDQIAIGRRLGPLQFHILDQFRLPSHPEIYVLTNLKDETGRPLGNANDGITWHTDLAGDVKARVYTLLYGVEVPPEGGDTLFASTQLAWDRLPAEKQQALERLVATYSYEQLYNARREMLAAQGIDNDYGELSGEKLAAARKLRRVEPIVRRHPATGRKGLYLGTLSFESIEGMEPDTARRTMEELVDYATGEAFRYRHRWQRGDVVVWDNRGLLHVATPYDKARHRRVVHRLSMEGAPPL
ncbi:TauD/TfdA family dioxygenase [Piscinibacter sakaiensis]|nr:TauD/TfdA family dioxygenase [Piscinibacter sakaiensis]